MYYLIISLIVLAAVALILAVLVQKSKGSGLASGFSSSNQIMGVRKTTDFIEKATWGLIITIMVLSLASTAFLKTTKTTETKSAIEVPIMPKAPTPEVNTTLPMPTQAPIEAQGE